MADRQHLLTNRLLGLLLVFAAPWMQAQTLSDSQRAQEFSRIITESTAAARQEVSIAPAVPDRFPDRWYPVRGQAVAMAPISGKPYSAVEVVTYRDKTPDGIISHEQRTTKMRDSEGRERTESISGGGIEEGVSYKISNIQVLDPVAHCVFHWAEKITSGEPIKQYEQASVRCGLRSWTTISLDVQALTMTMPGSEEVPEEHVKGNVDGLNYIGIRVLHPAKPEENAPFWGLETWYSPELHVQLRQFDVNENGTKINTATESSLTEIKQTEPDSALFYPPPTYKILTEQELQAKP